MKVLMAEWSVVVRVEDGSLMVIVVILKGRWI